MRKSAYWKQVEEWRTKYGVKNERPAAINLTRLRTACHRCQRHKPKMHRHHTGNDFFFACILPDSFAARYIQFHADDIEWLCDRCHRTIHKLYAIKMREIYLEIVMKHPTEETCRAWMLEFRTLFYEWSSRYRPRLATKPKKK